MTNNDFTGMERKDEIQVGIRLKQIDGYRVATRRDFGPGTTPHEAATPLTMETAKKQLGLYTSSAEATIVTRKTITFTGEWTEVDTSEVHELAVILHKKQCHSNHIDQCGWDYEQNWEAYTHKQYAEKAKKILEKTSFEAAKELLEVL